MNYKEIIESRYNRDAWQQLLHDIFLSKVVFRAPYEVKVNSHFAKKLSNWAQLHCLMSSN